MLRCGGNTLAAMGALNATNYIVASTDDLSGLFVLGINLYSNSRKSGALLSGTSTLSTYLIYSANYSTLNAAAVFDFFFHYDMKLLNRGVVPNQNMTNVEKLTLDTLEITTNLTIPVYTEGAWV